MSRLPLSLSLLVVLALGSAGCGKVRDIRACRGLAREVNGALDEIEALAKAKPIDELRIAKRYAALAKALEPRGLGETPLAQAVRDYIGVVQATDAALRAHAALAKVPSGKVADPRRELERLLKRERTAVLRIDATCEH